jgi:DNA-binding transcriptional MerR regulator
MVPVVPGVSAGRYNAPEPVIVSGWKPASKSLAFQARLVMTEKKRNRKNSSAAADPVIPDKLYFRIGEVSHLCRLPAYVLRFWETEFPQLKPVKSGTGQRMYRQHDVENVLRIKKLLYDQGFTIAGARQHLKDESKTTQRQSGLPFPKQNPTAQLKKVRQGLKEILGILSPRRK